MRYAIYDYDLKEFATVCTFDSFAAAENEIDPRLDNCMIVQIDIVQFDVADPDEDEEIEYEEEEEE